MLRNVGEHDPYPALILLEHLRKPLALRKPLSQSMERGISLARAV
jgi:hypothetical protein